MKAIPPYRRAFRNGITIDPHSPGRTQNGHVMRTAAQNALLAAPSLRLKRAKAATPQKIGTRKPKQDAMMTVFFNSTSLTNLLASAYQRNSHEIESNPG
jgi:hypothetical protein